MDFKSFSDISEYVREHTLDEMISYALRNSFYTHGYRYSSGKLNDQIDELNKLTSGKYTIVLGDTIKEEVTDIKQNLDRYGELHETLLVDDLSKKTLIELLAYRLTRNEKYIISAYCEKSQQYFDNSLVFFEKDCVYVDCGGFDGYTAAEFMLNCPYYKKVYIYEPIEQYFDLCRKNLAHLEMSNIILRNAAVYSSNTTLTFSKNVAGNSKLDASGKIMVNGVTLDNDISEQIDFIKMDIEGSEKEALLGAKRHINQEAPILAICIYHNPGDLWEIPFLIKELNKNYDLYLRHHTTGTDETVIYAVYKDKTKLKSNTGQKSIINTETEVECYRINYKAKISEIMTLREAKKYLMYQIINMQASEQLEKDTNEELRDWNRQLEEGKEYLKQQIENRDNIIAELREWITQLEAGKVYLEQQIENRDKALTELREWITQLEAGKVYLEQQIENRDKALTELREWIAQLEAGKAYLEQQIESRDNTLAELKAHLDRVNEQHEKERRIIEEQEQKVLMLTNENKKLAFYLNEELNKPWYKKIFCKNRKI